MRNAGLEEAQAGIKIAGRNINNLRYADNTPLMAESEEVYPVPPSPPSFLIFLASGPTVKSLPSPSNLGSSVLWPPHWSPCDQPLPT